MLFPFFQVVRCLRLLKKFDPNEFQPKSTVSNYKFGKKGQATDQVLELPLENCIYDMISAEGTKGITLVEVLLGNLTLVQLCGIMCLIDDMLHSLASIGASIFLVIAIVFHI